MSEILVNYGIIRHNLEMYGMRWCYKSTNEAKTKFCLSFNNK